MPRQIFISYRRDDEAGTAGRLYDHLIRVAKIPRERIFKDVDNIVPGTNFVQKLNSEIASCELMIAILGRRWVGAANEDGSPRLHDINDLVRIEIETALTRSIPLIPLLIDGARWPRPEQLPTSLHLLCQQQGIEVANANFDADIAHLVKAIEWHQTVARAKPKNSQPPQSRYSVGHATTVPAEKTHKTSAKNIDQAVRPVLKEELESILGGLYYMAESGISQYLYEVGKRLESGHGIRQDLNLALDYYQRAARAGYGKAHIQIERLLPPAASLKRK